MFNIGLSEILVVALVSIIVLDNSKVPVFLNLIKNIYRYFWVVKSRVRKLLNDTGIKELYEEHNVEKVNYIIGEDGKLYPTYNVDSTKNTAKILVVDDIPSNVKLLEAQLKAEYYTVIVAYDGEEAIDLVAEQQPDIILLDVMMPKMSGFEVCKKLKNDPLTTYIPIIMLTALHDTHDRVEGINAGADDFLTMPIDETALSARIKSLVRLKMIIDELCLRGKTNAEIGGVAESSIMDYSNQIFDANILVVDEDTFQAEQIHNVLKQRFRSIKILHDPKEALKVGIKDNYDLIISDMQFSKTDGLRLCSKFRSKVETRYTPILILSEDYDKSNLVKALDVGANDYLTVPLDESELIARVNSQVKRKRYQDALRMNLFNNIEMSIKDPLTNCYNR